MNSKSKLMIALGVSVIVLIPVTLTNAAFWRFCNGYVMKWPNDPAIHISTYSFPDNSVERRDLDNILYHWNNAGMSREFFPVRTFDRYYGFGNGKNEIVLQYFNDSRTLGQTALKYTSCFWWFDRMEIVEFDTEISFNLSLTGFGPPLEFDNIGEQSLSYTIAHELGHALGMEPVEGYHSNPINSTVMRESWLGECWCGSSAFQRVQPLADDIASTRWAYPSGNIDRDVAACAFRNFTLPGSNFTRVRPTVIPPGQNPPETEITVQRGTNFPVTGTFTNLGNQQETMEMVFVLSNNEIISMWDNVVAAGTGVINKGSFITFTWSAQVPMFIAPGDYRLGMIVDPNNAIPEKSEGNNVVRLPVKVNVPL